VVVVVVVVVLLLLLPLLLLQLTMLYAQFPQDTCGILNLHGIPGVMGGLIGAIVAVAVPDSDYSGMLVRSEPCVVVQIGSMEDMWKSNKYQRGPTVIILHF